MGMSKSMENKITQVNSSDFSKKVTAAKISPEAAKKIVVKNISETNLYPMYSRLYFLVNDDYVFSRFPSKLGVIGLTGYYVNMNDGKIEFKEIKERIQLKNQSVDDYYKF